MAASLPYLSSAGTIDTAFKRMKDAATPTRFTGDFVNTVLLLKGGTGSTIPAFMKKLGFIGTDGSPTPLYDRFRNEATSKGAVAEAIRIGYKPLFQANEFAHKAGDNELKGLVLQVTGLEKNNRVAQLVYSTFKKLCSHASFEEMGTREDPMTGEATFGTELSHKTQKQDGLRLSYTINLNLPATTNAEIFNAIFRSLKEHLLND